MFVFIVLNLVFLINSWANISIELMADQAGITLDDQVEVQIKITGKSGLDIDNIVGENNFEIENHGSSSSIQIINGDTSISKSIHLSLSPKKLGVLKFGPVVIKHDNKEYLSNIISFNVTKESVQNTQANTEKSYYIKATLSKKEAYVSQQLIYTFQLVSSSPIRNPEVKFPEFDGFWKEQLGDTKQSRSIQNGVNVTITEIQFALFPTSKGVLTIPAATLTGHVIGKSKGTRSRRSFSTRGSLFDSFFDNSMGGRRLKKIRIKTNPLLVNVKNVPTYAGAGKYSGLVGNFHLEASLDKNQVKKGESLTLDVKLVGDGNFFDASENLFQIPNIKTYDDKPEVIKRVGENGLIGAKIFKKALVPQTVGLLSIPPFELVIFNPTTASFENINSKAINVNILKNAADEKINLTSTNLAQKGASKKDIKVLGKDIMPLSSVLSKDLVSKKSGKLRIIVVRILIILLPILYLLLRLFKKQGENNLSQQPKIRSLKAFKILNTKIKKLDVNSNDYVDACSNIFKDYLGDKLDFDGRSLTALDLNRVMSPLKISGVLIENVSVLLKRLEQEKFGGGNLLKNESASLVSQILVSAKKIEKEVII